MKNLKYYLAKAQKEKWAIGQFNFSDLSQVKGIVWAAQTLKAPVILGTSEGESKFVGLAQAVAMRNIIRKETGLPIFLNLDHGKSFEYLKEAILAGYDMVHFDGSKLLLNDNIKVSKKVVDFAHGKGVLVEGEVGRFGTDASKVYQEKFEIKEEDLTKPEQALEYLYKTAADMLAVSIGTFHGVDTNGTSPGLRLEKLKEIANNPAAGKYGINVPLVLHGGSGTPQEDVKEAIKLGICKININTDLRVAFAKALKAELEKGEITPYKYLQEPINVVELITEQKIGLFGSQGKA